LTRGEFAGAAVIFIAAACMGLFVVRPFVLAPIGPDAAAPVIHFQRLVAGQPVEGYLSQTAKPLLTLVYGLLYAGTGDWRAISLAAIASYAALAALGTLVAYRLAGMVAGGFAVVALSLEPTLLGDVVRAYAVSWGMLACAVAGVAVTSSKPRYGLAGVSLAVGALARPEVLAVTAVALAWIAIGHLAARGGAFKAPPLAAWAVGLGLIAPVLLVVHDAAVMGDPLFWANTAANNSVGSAAVLTPRQVVGFVVRHFLNLGPVLLLLVPALVLPLLRHRPLTPILVVTIPLAVAAFFIATGVRGTILSSRYLIPIDVAALFGCAVGIGELATFARQHVAHDLPPRRRWIGTVAGAVLGVAVALTFAPAWPLDPARHETVARQQAKQANATRGIGELKRLLPEVPEWRGAKPPADAQPLVLIPPRFRAQAIVDLDLPLWAGTKSTPGLVSRLLEEPGRDVVVYHDTTDDSRSPVWTQLEVTRPTTVGARRIAPLFTDPAAGIWIVRIGDAEQ
jgi:hypothetical protein